MKKLAPETTRSILRDAVLVGVACAGLALAFNAVRADGLALVAQTPYQILVPCPDVKGETTGIAASDAALQASGTVVVDAREPDAFAAWHVEGARSVPYDWLEPPPPDKVAELIGAGATRVVVYGDGGDPDSGEQLAKELAGAGLRNVIFVVGGAGALGAPEAVEGTP